MRHLTAEIALHWFGLAFYVASALLFTSGAVFGRPGHVRAARVAAAIGLVPHGAGLLLRWVEVGHGPYMLRYEVLSANAWSAFALLVLFLWRRPDWAALGVIVAPIAILTMALGLSSSSELRELPPSLRSTWLVFHVVFAKFSAAAFILATGTAVLQVLKARSRRPWLARAPAPEVLDAYTVRLAGFGLIVWTVTIAAGAIWAHQSWGRYWGWDAIETWSLVCWITYGTFLHARVFFRMKPVPTAWAAIGAFAVFVLASVVLPFLITSLHSAYFQ